MAYNNGFPVGYQPMYAPTPQPYPQQMAQQVQASPQIQQPQQNPQSNPMIWVQGETGAKSYLLAPNTTLPLWDSESQTIYLKSADASGMPSMKILDYTIRDASNQQHQVPIVDNPVEYVTKEEFDDFVKEIKSQLRTPAKKGGKEE